MPLPSQPVAVAPSNGSLETTLARLKAQTQLEFELGFFGALLERRGSWVEVLRCQAKNLTLVKRYHEAMQLDRRLIQLCPTDSQIHYNLACSYALLNQYDSAFRTLRQALELGYRDFQFLRQDRDLEAIRKDPRFRQLLNEFES